MRLEELKEMPRVPEFADGGEVEDSGLVARIMQQRAKGREAVEGTDPRENHEPQPATRMFSRGGMVADHMQSADEVDEDMEGGFDELAKDDELEFSETGANSGDELGDAQEDEDRSRGGRCGVLLMTEGPVVQGVVVRRG